MTGFKSKKAAALDKLNDDDDTQVYGDALTIAYQSGYYDGKKQRPWVGLTEKQFTEAARLAEDGNYLVAFQRIQQWLKEKNA